jgi:hypothetical protein
MGAFPIDASIAGACTLLEGEPVVYDALLGYLIEAGDDNATITGIAAAPSLGMNATGEAGHLGGSATVPDATARPNGTFIQFYKPVAGQIFLCSNFATDGAGTAVVPTVANAVGRTAGFTLAGGNYVVDRGCANHHVEIVAVIDANAIPLGDTLRTPGAGVTVVFGFLT